MAGRANSSPEGPRGRAHLAGTTEGDWAGVRPSPGAAAFDLLRTLQTSATLLLADVAAPEDGRTPVLRL